MSIALAPTTELDAVNQLLATIGEAPINQITNLGLSDAATAYNELYNASRRTQKRGWSWNTDFIFTLVPDTSGNLWLPANTLKVTFVGASMNLGLTARGTRVYDSVNHTYTFAASQTANIVGMLPYTQLSEAARQFIFLAAGVRFQAGILGSDILYKFTTADATQAWSDLLSEELELANPNILTDSTFMQDALNRVTVGNIGMPDAGF